MAADNISKFYQAFNQEFDNFKTEEDFRVFLSSAKEDNIDKLYDAFNSVYDNFKSRDEMVEYLGWKPAGAATPEVQAPAAKPAQPDQAATAPVSAPPQEDGYKRRIPGAQVRTLSQTVAKPAVQPAQAPETQAPEVQPAEQATRTSTANPYVGKPYAELEQMRKDASGFDAFIQEYERRYKEWNKAQDYDLDTPELEAEKAWLDENNKKYRDAKKQSELIQNAMNYAPEGIPASLERIDKKDKDVRSHILTKDINYVDMVPQWGANVSAEDRLESDRHQAASEILHMAKQTLKQSNKYDPGYEGNPLEQIWTAVRQFGADAANNIDMGSLTMGASEGRALILARNAGERSNAIVNDTLKGLGYDDKSAGELLRSLEESGSKIDELSKTLGAAQAEILTMEAAYQDMLKSGADKKKVRAYAEEYNRKVKEFNKRFKDEYEPLKAEYDKKAGEYSEVMKAVELALDGQLSDGDKALLDALAEYTDAQMRRSSDVSIAGRAGAGAEQSAEFMLDFILTGGLSKAGGKAATKFATNRLLKKTLGEKGANIAARGLVDAGVAAARTSLMFPRNLRAYGEQLTEMSGEDELGRYRFDRSHLNAALNTALTQYIEYWSEGFGEYFGAGEQAAFKTITKRAPAVAIGKTLDKYRGSIGRYLDNGKFDGMFNEMLEEVVGSLLNSTAGWLSGDRLGDSEAIKEFWSGDQLATLFFSFLPMSAISAGTNLRAYNKMKQRYNAGAEMLNPFLESGAVSREELEELVTGIPDMTPQEVKNKVVDIADKARKANMGILPSDFTKNLMGYLEGAFSMRLNSEQWENSAEKMRVVDSYSDTYASPDPRAAWDINREEQLARGKMTKAGFTDSWFDLDPYAIAQKAATLRDTDEERADVLMDYATAKAAAEGLRDGYAAQTEALVETMGNFVRENLDNVGNVIIADFNGSPVAITTSDAEVTPDGKVKAGSGDGVVLFVSLAGDGQRGIVKANALRGASSIPTEDYISRRAQEMSDKLAQEYEQLSNTISPKGMALELAGNLGRTVDVRDGNGVYEPVKVEKITGNGSNVVISGDKKFLQGLAMAMGIQSPGGSQIEVPIPALYSLLAKEDDGSLSSSQPGSEAQTAPEGSDLDLMGEQTIYRDGQPMTVNVTEVGDGQVQYLYTDENGREIPGSMAAEDFQQAMQAPESPAAPAEEAPAAAGESEAVPTTTAAEAAEPQAPAGKPLPTTKEGDTDWTAALNSPRESFSDFIPTMVAEMPNVFGNPAESARKWYSQAGEKIKELEGKIAKESDPNKEAKLTKELLAWQNRRANAQALFLAFAPKQAETTAPAPASAAPATEATEEGEAPDVSKDTPEAAQKRGYIIQNGNRIDRSAPDAIAVTGKDTSISFGKSKGDVVEGKYGLMDADRLVPSHINNQANPLHFFASKWQPKDRNNADSASAIQVMANNLRPAEITEGTTAYVGAPIVNARGEVIQGNGRSEALRRAYQQGSAADYRDWLADNAQEFGLTREQVESLENPVLVRALDVDDAIAGELGQKSQADLESGGDQTFSAGPLVKKLGDKLGDLIEILFRGDLGDDATLTDYINANGQLALRWLHKNGYINDTEFQNALKPDRSGFTESTLTAFKNMGKELLIGNSSPAVAEGYKDLQNNAKLALQRNVVLLSRLDGVLPDIREALAYYHDFIAGDPAFQNATSVEAAQKAVQDWMNNIQLNGQSEAELHPNEVARAFAARFKGTTTIKGLTALFRSLAASMQGEVGVFGETEAVDRASAYKQLGLINAQENGEQGEVQSVPESGDNTGAEGRPGGEERPAGSGSERAGRTGARRRDSGRNGSGEVKQESPEKAPAEFGAKNTLFTRDDFEAALREFKDITGGTLSAGINFNALGPALRMAGFVVEGGVRKFVDFAQTMLKYVGEAIRPYLKSAYKAIRSYPGMEEIAKEMNTDAEVDAIDVNTIGKEEENNIRNGENRLPDNGRDQKPESAGAEEGVDPLLENETQEIRDAVDAIVSGKDTKKREVTGSTPDDFTIGGKDINSYIRDRYDRFKSPLEKSREELRKELVAYRSRIEDEARADIMRKNPHIKEDNPYLPDYVSEEADKRLKNDEKYNSLNSQITAIDNEIGNYQARRYNAFAAIEEIYAKNQETAEPETEGKPKKNVPQSAESEKESVSSQVDIEAGRKFSDTVAEKFQQALIDGEKPYKSINDLRAEARRAGLEVDERGADDILLQELVEVALVKVARGIMENRQNVGRTSRTAYDEICRLYELQPTLGRRSSDRVNLQQYSTPLPMSFVAQMFAYDPSMRDVLEPTAGNGMLVFAIPSDKVHVNEIDQTRHDNLVAQGYKEVTQNDATGQFEGKYDAVIANPPFGSHEAVRFDGKEISGLDPVITLRALDAMKDDGRAAIIIGGNVEWADNGSWKTKKAFFAYLYDHYNVKGVVNMSGDLYAKQGTTYPTMMILIDGRRSEAERAEGRVYPPVAENARPAANTQEELYDIVKDILQDNRKTDGKQVKVVRSEGSSESTDSLGQQGSLFAMDSDSESDSAGDNAETGRRGQGGEVLSTPEREVKQDVAAGKDAGVPSVGSVAKGKRREPDSTLPEHGDRGLAGTRNDSSGESVQGTVRGAERTDNGREGEKGTNGRAGEERLEPVHGGKSTLRERVRVEREKRSTDSKNLSYVQHSGGNSLDSVAPAAMVEAMDVSLEKIEEEVGKSIDEFVMDELGYKSGEELYNALAAEQIDSVAMAIYNMKHGGAMIIGDQTGVGKGRQMAALIRWANRQGKKPIFMTQKAGLFSDIYRDMAAIGSAGLKPLILNAAVKETDKETGRKHYKDTAGVMLKDKDGELVEVYKCPSNIASIIQSGKVPPEYDYVVLTYSQLNNGDAQSRAESKNKKAIPDSALAKAKFIRSIAGDNYLLMDESHTAAGSGSNSGAFLRSILPSVAGVTFSSATFAKRPDTMPLYAIKSAISQANVKPEELIQMIERGGVTLQEIMARALTASGQMVRRERDMSDVKTDWKTIDDPVIAKKARDNYDKALKIFNDIIDFQHKYIDPFIQNVSSEIAETMGVANYTQGTKNFGIDNPSFVSQTFNFTKQLMLALKVDAIVSEVTKEIEAGRHPVIALENTYESGIQSYNVGDEIKDTSFSAGLIRSLERLLQYTVTDEDGKSTTSFSPSELGPAGEQAYYDLQQRIKEATKDIFLSPLDAIREKLNEKGYSVGEVTGRKTQVVKGDNGYVLAPRDADAKQTVANFNRGAIDVIIINKSGSTGISLHASKEFKDQRQRSMIIAQPLGDINDYMQMIGRIDRTGQVHRGYYINLSLPVPAELRFNMMLATKLKSLNANTTTSQESDTGSVDAPDFLNKYGSQVVIEYLRDHPELFAKLIETELKLGDNDNHPQTQRDLEDYKPSENDAQKVTGRIALFPVVEQEAFYKDIAERYNALIKYLDETGENTLKITTLPLRAKTLARRIGTEGKDPYGSNPFAQNSYVERVEVDVLRKPMKAAEVRKVRETLLGGKTPEERQQEISDRLKAQKAAALETENARYEKKKEKVQKEIDKQAEAIRKTGRPEVEIRAEINRITGLKMAEVEDEHTGNVNSITTKNNVLRKRFQQFNYNDTYLIHETIIGGNLFEGAGSPSLFLGYKTAKAGDNITPSTSFAVFATLDGRRRIEIKFTDSGVLDEISDYTNLNYQIARQTNIDDWDNSISSATREQRYMLTGNILQAWSDATVEGVLPGRLISYTDIDGNIRDGILMNNTWQTSALRSSGAPISTARKRIEDMSWGDSIESVDREVEISKSRWGYELSVPKSKKSGAKYFDDKELLSLVSGSRFYQHRGRFMADFSEVSLPAVLKRLSDIGVRVTSDEEGREWEEVDNSQTNSAQSEDQTLYREETDADILERLDSEPAVEAYRAMQFIPDPNGDWEYDLGDGKGMQKGNLYPPMSAVVDGKWRPSVKRNSWERSEERPDLADDKGRFVLNKGNKKGLKAAYNPYFHSSDTMLNDQFAQAQTRDNLVVVKVMVPEREVSESNMNPYHAEKAKDSVGKHEWKAGPIQQQLTGTRSVYLSRWDKPVEIVPVDKVADSVAGMVRGQVKEMPSNVVWPQLRAELEKRGVQFVETDNTGAFTDGERKGQNYQSFYSTKNRLSKAEQKQLEKERQRERAERAAESERIRRVEREATEKALDTMSVELGIKINRVGRGQMPVGHESDKGYYDPKTGEMSICMDNVMDERDAVATVLHETVGHNGLRKLFGDRFNEAMVRIYAALDVKGKAWVSDYMARHNLRPGQSDAIIRGVEEYLSHLAERGDFKSSVWDRIKALFGRIIDKIFGTDGFILTDRELQYILRVSYENLKNPAWLDTVNGEAKDFLMKRESGINNTDPRYPTDPEAAEAGLLFRDGDTGVAKIDYEEAMKDWKNVAVMEHQNADQPVKIGLDKIMKETGKGSIAESEDYLTRHNLASSRAETQAHEFELFRFTPMLEQVREIQRMLMGQKGTKEDRQKSYERILDYLYAVSALERNAYKNDEIEQEKQAALENAATPAEITAIVDFYDARKKDWSGITSLMGRPADEWREAEADAQAMIDEFDADVNDEGAIDELWNRIRRCTDYNLEHAYRHGLLSREEFERLRGTASQPRMWEYYLPLRGFSGETAEEEYNYANLVHPQSNSVVVKKMNGRWTQADNPLANILNIAQTEIVQGNDNWAKQALYRFLLSAGKNTLLSQGESWYVKNPADGTWTLAEPYDYESLEEFEERMNALRDNIQPDGTHGEPLAKRGRNGLALDKIMANKGNRNEHLIRLKVGGLDKMIWVNGNPAIARAVAGTGRAQNMKTIRRASRALSNLFTTYSLDFTARNLIRDTIYSRMAISVKEDGAYGHQFKKNWWSNFGYGAFAFPMVRLMAQWENGTLQQKANPTKREQLFMDFMRDGGQTGYTIINSVDKIKRDLERSMRRAGEDVAGVRVPILGHYAQFVKTLNEAFELLTRFTAYQTSRDMGRSGQRAASDAKEISVNFNRKGMQSGDGVWGVTSAYLGATHYFYNAGVQGFDNFLRLFKANPVKMSVTTGAFVLMGILTPIMNAAFAAIASGDGDDDDKKHDWYWNLPEWVRRNNIVLGTGSWYLAVPLPVELRAFYGVGDIAGALMYNKVAASNGFDVGLDVLNTASGILPVNPVEGYSASNKNIGDALLRTVAPDATMFFVDWATNRDYTGRPLWKENPFSDTVPKSQGAYASTPKALVEACQWMAKNFGWDIAPGVLRDALKNYGGGFYNAAEDVSKMLFTDAERPFRYDNIPFFSGFTGHIDEDRSNSFVTSALYDYEKLSDKVVRDLNMRAGTKDITASMAYDHPETLPDGARVQRILEGEDYILGKMYRDGMNNEYVMKQRTTGKNAGEWYKSREIKRKGVNTLKKEWQDLREQLAAMPSGTIEEKSAKAELELKVQDAWHVYYNAQADLVDRLMEEEYNHVQRKRENGIPYEPKPSVTERVYNAVKDMVK